MERPQRLGVRQRRVMTVGASATPAVAFMAPIDMKRTAGTGLVEKFRPNCAAITAKVDPMARVKPRSRRHAKVMRDASVGRMARGSSAHASMPTPRYAENWPAIGPMSMSAIHRKKGVRPSTKSAHATCRMVPLTRLRKLVAARSAAASVCAADEPVARSEAGSEVGGCFAARRRRRVARSRWRRRGRRATSGTMPPRAMAAHMRTRAIEARGVAASMKWRYLRVGRVA